MTRWLNGLLHRERIDTWLDAHLQGGCIVVVSPHLDDAVYSAYSLMNSRRSHCTVVTVITQADESTNSAWARITGFRDAIDEYSNRRIEDRAAMESIGVRWHHMGGIADHPSNADIARVAQVVSDQLAVYDKALVLLPAGVGRPIGKRERLVKRITRRPTGAPPHGEHLLVRDGVLKSLSELKARGMKIEVGFYAEIPYVWNGRPDGFQASLESMLGEPLKEYTCEVDPPSKLAACEKYASQSVPILGGKRRYRQKVVGRDELYFLPATANPGNTH